MAKFKTIPQEVDAVFYTGVTQDVLSVLGDKVKVNEKNEIQVTLQEGDVVVLPNVWIIDEGAPFLTLMSDEQFKLNYTIANPIVENPLDNTSRTGNQNSNIAVEAIQKVEYTYDHIRDFIKGAMRDWKIQLPGEARPANANDSHVESIINNLPTSAEQAIVTGNSNG